MTIYEANNFYKLDKKEYDIKNNKEFLTWLNDAVDQGYNPFIDLDEIEHMINQIVNWYELKYPNFELENQNGITNIHYEYPIELSNYMDYYQLFLRLPHNARCLMECGYRSSCWGYPHIYISIKRKSESPILNDTFLEDLIKVDHYSGIVSEHDIENIGIITNAPLLIDDLLNILMKNERNDIDYTDISHTVYLHKIDLQLRKKVLELVALKLLYSKNTIPEYGYERAKKFIEEFNSEIYCLNLSTNEIDEIINYDYKKQKSNEETIPKIETKKAKQKLLSKLLPKKNHNNT